MSTPAGEYFDGDSAYSEWEGEAHNSVSQMAAVTTVIDHEVPLDVEFYYQVSAPNQPSFTLFMEPMTVDSLDQTWLLHPDVGIPVKVIVAAEPGGSRTIDRGVFQVIGRARPIAVTGGVRHSIEADMELYTFTFGDRDRILEFLQDGQPLLLRAPARLGHGPGEWLSIGDVELKAHGHGAWEGPRSFTFSYTVVDPPASALSA